MSSPSPSDPTTPIDPAPLPTAPAAPPIPPMTTPPASPLNPYLLTNVNVIIGAALTAICLIGAIILAAIHDGAYVEAAFTLFQYVVVGTLGGGTIVSVAHIFRNGNK